MTLREEIAKIIAENDSVAEGYNYCSDYSQAGEILKEMYRVVADEILDLFTAQEQLWKTANADDVRKNVALHTRGLKKKVEGLKTYKVYLSDDNAEFNREAKVVLKDDVLALFPEEKPL